MSFLLRKSVVCKEWVVREVEESIYEREKEVRTPQETTHYYKGSHKVALAVQYASFSPGTFFHINFNFVVATATRESFIDKQSTQVDLYCQ